MTPAPKQPSRPRSRRPASSAPPLQVVRLHPLMRRHLNTDDLRRIQILRVHESLAVDVIVRNRPVTSR